MRNLVVFPLLIVTAAVLAQGQNDSGTDGVNFQGRILYENNAPAQFVRVELWTDGESTWRTSLTTDRSGKFHTGAPCMVIQYKVEELGFRPVLGRVDISLNPCRTLVDITLRAIRDTTAPSSAVPRSASIDARIAAIPPEASKEFETGHEAVKNNDFEGAIPHLQKAISLYPRYAEAYQLLGLAQLQTNRGPQAESSLVKAIEIEDKMPGAQYLLGVLYAKTGRVSLAEKPLTRFAELDPQNPDAYFELAKVSFALNKFPDAEMHARKSIELKETNAGVNIVLGYALLRQKQPEHARQALQQFLQQDPNSPMAADVKKLIGKIDEQLQAAGHSPEK
jgi:Flp pilus assembly protein TadD